MEKTSKCFVKYTTGVFKMKNTRLGNGGDKRSAKCKVRKRNFDLSNMGGPTISHGKGS